MTFAALGLDLRLLSALEAAGYSEPTPVQAEAIPALLANRDICGTAQTGTGKTAAFALPILHRIATTPPRDGIRALILAPTRELAEQIGASFAQYGRNLPYIRCSVVIGGMKPRAQKRALDGGVDILVATPGRLLDLCGRGAVQLHTVECFVLDEADRMLDMGFIKDVRSIAARMPPKRQTILFSATMPPPVERFATSILRNPVRISVDQKNSVAEGVSQLVYYVGQPEKGEKLKQILADRSITSAIVFVRTKKGADRIAGGLIGRGIRVAVIHSDREQSERSAALAEFKSGRARIMVATEIAARGLDIDGVSHVINHDIPTVAESYVHRVGRTARAGAIGTAISLCAPEEVPLLREIERLTGVPLQNGDAPEFPPSS